MQHFLQDISRRLLLSSRYLENQISIFCRSGVFIINIKGHKLSKLSTMCVIFPVKVYLEPLRWSFRRKQLTAFSRYNFFRKKLHSIYLNRFWMCLWTGTYQLEKHLLNEKKRHQNNIHGLFAINVGPQPATLLKSNSGQWCVHRFFGHTVTSTTIGHWEIATHLAAPYSEAATRSVL